MAPPKSTDSPLRNLRLALSMSLEVLEAKTGIDTGTLSRIERGQRKCAPRLAEKLVQALNVPGFTEMHLLYPERFKGAQNASSQSVGAKSDHPEVIKFNGRMYRMVGEAE